MFMCVFVHVGDGHITQQTCAFHSGALFPMFQHRFPWKKETIFCSTLLTSNTTTLRSIKRPYLGILRLAVRRSRHLRCSNLSFQFVQTGCLKPQRSFAAIFHQCARGHPKGKCLFFIRHISHHSFSVAASDRLQKSARGPFSPSATPSINAFVFTYKRFFFDFFSLFCTHTHAHTHSYASIVAICYPPFPWRGKVIFLRVEKEGENFQRKYGMAHPTFHESLTPGMKPGLTLVMWKMSANKFSI